MDPAQNPLQSPPQNDPNAGYRPRNEKEEKGQEKQQEKGQGLDEKYRRDPAGFVAFAFVIIWLGVFLLLRNQGVISDDDRGWAVFAWGVAAIFIIEILVRLLVPRWRQPLGGSFIPLVIAVGVGFGLWTDDWEIVGPIAVIAVGVAILAGRLVPRR
jgi:hypothetical protein